MQRDANHDALDFAFFDQRREGLEIDLATFAIEFAARKREGAFVVRNGETNTFASHVECEGLHRAWNCSGSSGDETEPKLKHERNEIKKRDPKNCRRLRSARGLSRSGEDPVGSNCCGPSADVLVRVSGRSHQQIARFGRVPVGGEGERRAFCTAQFSIGSSSRVGRAVFEAKVCVEGGFISEGEVVTALRPERETWLLSTPGPEFA